MTPEQKAHRLELGIPVHESDAEHEWRSDGYCNCGEKRRRERKPAHCAPTGGVVGKSNLDVIERNWSEYR
jgi:hypothetical protein